MDRWFKRTFGWAPARKLMTLFLQELIPEREIVDLDFGPQEHINPIEAGKDIRLDVNCTDKSGACFVVEVQVARQAGFYDRAVFNSTFAVQHQIQKGERAFSFPPVYFIGVMDFSIHQHSDQVLFRYCLQEKDSHELMTDSLQYIFLELPNCHKALTPEATLLDNFCYALHNIGKMEERPAGLQGEIFDLLFSSAEITTFAGYEREKYFEDMTTKEDIQRMIAYAEDKGMEKKAIETAKNLAALGVDMDIISQATGLSTEEVTMLQK